MSASPEPVVPDPVSPVTSQRPGPHPAVMTLLIIIAVLLALVVGLLLTRGTGGSSAPAPASEAATPATTQAASPTAPPTAAPSETDPKVLALMHAEVRRDPQDGQARGAVDAPVVMVLYSDFSCPYCTLFAQEVAPGLEDLVEDGTLRVEWRDLAQISESSPLAAQAGVAAANQGRFWELHDAVYAAADPQDHPEYTQESLLALAEEAGVEDLERFAADMVAQETVDAVEQSRQHAYEIGIRGTPFLIVNDAAIGGFVPLEYVRQTVLDQAALAG